MTQGALRVTCYHADRIEHATLAPIAEELVARGHAVDFTDDFDQPSEVGLYACHGNRFFDFARGEWNDLPSEISVMCTHDFAQAEDAGIQYFAQDGWHRFDLGLIPGKGLADWWARAATAGYASPRRGMVAIGWPKSDRALRDDTEFEVAKQVLRTSLDIDERPILLLACSWSNRQQLTDLLSTEGISRFNVVARYPHTTRPPDGSPWSAVLNEAYDELQLTIKTATSLDGVTVADPATDLYELLSMSDAVISNGSNVLFEGLVVGKPGVSVTSWTHPAGPTGRDRLTPHVEHPGVVDGPSSELEAMIIKALHPTIDEFVRIGRGLLIGEETLGRASALAAEAIEDACLHQSELQSLKAQLEQCHEENARLSQGQRS